jgi:hypothetical protein
MKIHAEFAENLSIFHCCKALCGIQSLNENHFYAYRLDEL